MTAPEDRKSALAFTGVSPITVYQGSKDYLDVDINKSRAISNITISQYNSSNLLNSDINLDKGINQFDLPENLDTPSVYGISVIKNELYLDASGKSRARLAFKIINPDVQKIVDVDIRHSIASAESGL